MRRRGFKPSGLKKGSSSTPGLEKPPSRRDLLIFGFQSHVKMYETTFSVISQRLVA